MLFMTSSDNLLSSSSDELVDEGDDISFVELSVDDTAVVRAQRRNRAIG